MRRCASSATSTEYGNLLLRWLTNDTFVVRQRRAAVFRNAASRLVLRP